MSASARSLFVFAVYVALLGATLLVAPNALLALFAYPTTGEVWIRVLGMLMVLLAFYYVQAARKELTDLIRWSVYTRGSVILFLIAFVGLGFARPILILFGVVDLAGAIWTEAALRSARRASGSKT
jgi:hypothetical protein